MTIKFASQILGAALATLIATSAQAITVTWDEADGGNGHSYEFVSGTYTPRAGFAEAESRTHNGAPGHLVTVTSKQEWKFLKNLYSSLELGTERFWLGGTDVTEEGTWRWAAGPESGTLIDYSVWAPGEPNDYGKGEDYMVGWWNGIGQWNDWYSSSEAGILVEYSQPAPVPLPASLMLLLSSLGALYVARRPTPSTTRNKGVARPFCTAGASGTTGDRFTPDLGARPVSFTEPPLPSNVRRLPYATGRIRQIDLTNGAVNKAPAIGRGFDLQSDYVWIY
ncbi:MAG: lectin-like protein [Pseudomonadota bacterium]